LHTHRSQANERGSIAEDTRRSVTEGRRIANPPYFMEKGFLPASTEPTLFPEPLRHAEAGRLNRACTVEYKIDPLTKCVRDLLGLRPGDKHITKNLARVAETSIGIGYEERSRAKNEFGGRVGITLNYPLVDAQTTTDELLARTVAAGHRKPIKSACIGCPFRNAQSWARMERDDPEAFAVAVAQDLALREPFGRGRLNDGKTRADYLEDGDHGYRVKGAIFPAYLYKTTPTDRGGDLEPSTGRPIALGDVTWPEVDDTAAETFGGEC
jgi:hypothetical protein